MHINPSIFRKYDIRGIANEDLQPDFVKLFGYVTGRYFQEHGEEKVLLGRDNRESSDRIRDNLLEGLLAAGCHIVDIGTVTTPIFYYSRVAYDLNAGLMVTASHNPGEYNGFKVALGHATIFGDDILDLLARMEQARARLGGIDVDSFLERQAAGLADNLKDLAADRVASLNPAERYFQMMEDKIELGPKELKVVVDCGNGTASLFAEELFTRLGCEVVPLYCESNPEFPNHHPDPVKTENLLDLRDMVLAEGADLGVGFDGDGDRIGVVDDQGNIIWGDTLMILFWREILPKYPGTTAIIEVKCSEAVVREVERLGGKAIFYKTGHSFIKAKMKELAAVFTGEMSGHMFFADEYYGYDDAFYAAARLLRVLSNSEESLSGLLADIPVYYSTAEKYIKCSEEAKFRVVENLKEDFVDKYEVIDVDGVRVLFPDGWGLARCSNTQPAIVGRCEANSKEALVEICQIMREALLKYPEVEDFQWEY
ncbi:MAG: phosphomannomutase/phosphoglucomutase [Halanaerobium sp.]|nr:phosphomannomutase/phosphoglucomutase [Halanaerobium sp.]